MLLLGKEDCLDDCGDDDDDNERNGEGKMMLYIYTFGEQESTIAMESPLSAAAYLEAIIFGMEWNG